MPLLSIVSLNKAEVCEREKEKARPSSSKDVGYGAWLFFSLRVPEHLNTIPFLKNISLCFLLSLIYKSACHAGAQVKEAITKASSAENCVLIKPVQIC